MARVKRRPQPQSLRETGGFYAGDVVRVLNDYQTPVLNKTLSGWMPTGERISPVAGSEALCLGSLYMEGWPVVELETNGRTVRIAVIARDLEKL